MMGWLSKTTGKFISVLAFFENAICYTGLLAVTFLVFFNVLNRHLFRFEIMWVGDFSLYLFMIFVFSSIMFTTREKGHTSVEIFAQKLFQKVPGARKPYSVFLVVLSILTAGFFAIPVYHFAERSMKYPQYGTLVRWFNTSWIMQAMLIMVIIVIFHLIQHLVIEIHINSSAGKPEREQGVK
jgi:C4-dicarboxylate transporter, DctQ subunit